MRYGLIPLFAQRGLKRRSLDIVKVDDDNCLFYIADVSGHGVRSALLTIFAPGDSRHESGSGRSCGRIK